MNNNMRFDPMTGEPIQINEQPINNPIVDPNINNIVQNIQPNAEPIIFEQEQPINNPIVDPNINIAQNIQPNIEQPINQNIDNFIENNDSTVATAQNQLQGIPTVEQNTQDFINNIQAMNKVKKEEKKEGINFVFIITLFAIILAIIIFLFPVLAKYV